MKKLVAFLLLIAFSPVLDASKPNPSGLYVLIAGLINNVTPFGTATNAHPNIDNANVDGFRIKAAWWDVETSDNTYDWTQINNALARAVAVNKKISMSSNGGLQTPPWVFGGQKFTDASYTAGQTGITSTNANFSSTDAGRYVSVGSNLNDQDFPIGTTLQLPITNAGKTMATNLAAKTGRSGTAKPFWILSRISGRAAPYLTLTSPVYTDGSWTSGAATLTATGSTTFASADINRIIGMPDLTAFPAGTIITAITDTTHVVTSQPANNSGSGNFWMVNRGGNTITDAGIMALPWDPYFVSKFKEHITEFGRLYDSKPNLSYVVYTGVALGVELYTTQSVADDTLMDQLAAADPNALRQNGTRAANATEAWLKPAEGILDTFMTAFPTTAIEISFAKPFQNGSLKAVPGGTLNLEDAFEAYAHSGVRVGRIAYMCNSLAVDSGVTYVPNSYIIANHLDSPAGWQMVGNATAVLNGVLRIGTAGPPDNTSPPALFDTLIRGANMQDDPTKKDAADDQGGRWVEIYEPDYSNNTITTTELTDARARLKAVPGPANQPGGTPTPPPTPTPTPTPSATPFAVKIIIVK